MNGANYNDLTILVVSYDGYQDLWPDFFNCKNTYWPDCPFETVLANNTANVEFSDVRVINCGSDALWSTRTRQALGQINSKYVLFLLEDFYIAKKVDNNLVFGALELMKKQNIRYYKLLSLSKIRTTHFGGLKHLYAIPANYRYGISLMAAIWDTELLKEKVGVKDYNPWKFEIDRNDEALQADSSLVGVYDNRNILNICHMVVQGKYLPNALTKMRNRGYHLLNTNRTIMKGKEYLIYRVINVYYNLQNRFPIIKCLAAPLIERYSITSRNR